MPRRLGPRGHNGLFRFLSQLAAAFTPPRFDSLACSTRNSKTGKPWARTSTGMAAQAPRSSRILCFYSPKAQDSRAESTRPLTGIVVSDETGMQRMVEVSTIFLHLPFFAPFSALRPEPPQKLDIFPSCAAVASFFILASS